MTRPFLRERRALPLRLDETGGRSILPTATGGEVMRDLHDDMDHHERRMTLDLTGETRLKPADGSLATPLNSVVDGKVGVGRSTVHAGGRDGPQRPSGAFWLDTLAWTDATADLGLVWDAADAAVASGERTHL